MLYLAFYLQVNIFMPFPFAGHLGSAICLVAATFVGHDTILVVTLVTVGIAINGATHGGYGVNHVDIAPNHAGVLQALTSTIASLCAIGAPYVAGSIINENVSVLEGSEFLRMKDLI